MTGISCREARDLLQACSEGRAIPHGWAELFGAGTIAGTPAHPMLTPEGAQTLRALDLRAYRADAEPLEAVLAETRHVVQLIDQAARAAEVFLTDLGPITPPEALPYLRVVAVGLANRRGEPDELVERFRQVWGMVEVMDGDARDRLLAAELLDAAGASESEIYAPMIRTTDRLRSAARFGPSRPPPSCTWTPTEPPDPPIDEWREARRALPTDEMAALLAMITVDPAGRQRFETFRAEVSPGVRDGRPAQRGALPRGRRGGSGRGSGTSA